MVYILTIYLIGLNIAPWVFGKLGFWQSQAFWSQIMGLIMFGVASMQETKTKIINKPFWLFLIWAGINTAWILYTTVNQGNYNIAPFLVLYNIITFYFIYDSIVKFLKYDHVVKIIELIRWIAVANISVCVLQYFEISQFFALYDPTSKYFNNPVVGFISQPTMLSGFLGMLTPIFLYRKKREDYLFLILIWTILLFYTGTTFGHPASSGILAGIFSMLAYGFYAHRKTLWIPLITILLGLIIYFVIPHQIRQSLESGGFRLETWGYYIDLFIDGRIYIPENVISEKSFYLKLLHENPVTGAGLNIINSIRLKTPFPGVTHLHFEIFQLMFELGIIGLIIFLYGLHEFFSIKTDYKKEEAVIKSVMIGFLVSSCFNYPAHLWIIMGYICFFYAALFVLKHESKETNLECKIQ